MIDFILNCILWTLALYGFWDILKIIKSTLKNRVKAHKRITTRDNSNIWAHSSDG